MSNNNSSERYQKSVATVGKIVVYFNQYVDLQQRIKWGERFRKLGIVKNIKIESNNIAYNQETLELLQLILGYLMGSCVMIKNHKGNKRSQQGNAQLDNTIHYHLFLLDQLGGWFVLPLIKKFIGGLQKQIMTLMLNINSGEELQSSDALLNAMQ